MKKTAAVNEIKAQLSRFLRRVKAGEEILITERNVPIARIVPIGRDVPDRAQLLDLERQGLVRVGSGALPKGFWKLPRGRDRQAAVRRALTDERERGW